MNPQKEKQNCTFYILTTAILLLLTLFLRTYMLLSAVCKPEAEASSEADTTMHTSAIPTSDAHATEESGLLDRFASEHGLPLSAWPDSLIELLEKNPEAEAFVLHYPFKKDQSPEIDLREYIGSAQVPLFLQWDERWGYSQYSGELMGLSGCGPTCLSMVCIYLLNDPQYTPEYVAAFAEQNGYSVPGKGSSWTLISEGGKELGLDVIEIPLDETRIIQNLEAGNPIICAMGPGDFTTTGHFIVMTGFQEGKLKINDPNSPARSNTLWEYDKIKDQISNLWVCRL